MNQKVAILVNSLLSGGAERFVSLILNSLKDNFEFHLLILDKIIEYELPPGQIVVDLGSKGTKSADVANMLKLPFISRRLKKYCDQHEIPLVISFLARPNLAACLAKRSGMKARVLISERSYTPALFKHDEWRGKIGRYIITSLYPYADAILPNSTGTRIALEEDFKIKKDYIVIKNAIDLEGIRTKKEEFVEDVSFDKFTFVCLAGFRSEKNHRMLVQAFAALEDTNTQLLLIGAGNKMRGEGDKVLKDIQYMVKFLGIEKRVLFLGQKDNPFKYLQRADCLVLASNFEGFPNVLIEAMACGLPVISTDCPMGPREILSPSTMGRRKVLTEKENEEYGMLVPVGNAAALTSAMEEMIKDQELRAVYKAKGIFRAAGYDHKVVMNEFKQIVNEYLPQMGENSTTS